MNNEGVSSLPVLDAQNNVIGNISHVDVRVSLLCSVSYYATNGWFIALDQIHISPTASLILYSLYICHLV